MDNFETNVNAFDSVSDGTSKNGIANNVANGVCLAGAASALGLGIAKLAGFVKGKIDNRKKAKTSSESEEDEE